MKAVTRESHPALLATTPGTAPDARDTRRSSRAPSVLARPARLSIGHRSPVISTHLQRKILSAIAKQTINHVPNTAICGHSVNSASPRSMLARKASFVAVSGSALMNGCTACGKFSDEKNTPDNTHIGSIDRFIKPDTPSIVLDRDAMSNPRPPNASALTMMIVAIDTHEPRIGTSNNTIEKP